jgi:hypothetical protein
LWHLSLVLLARRLSSLPLLQHVVRHVLVGHEGDAASWNDSSQVGLETFVETPPALVAKSEENLENKGISEVIYRLGWLRIGLELK